MSLTTYDLPAVFACGVETGRAISNYRPEEHAGIPLEALDIDAESFTEDPDVDQRFAATFRRHRVLDAIEETSNRLKRALGASGPLDVGERLWDKSTPTWESYHTRFQYASHAPQIRQSLRKLANASLDASGYATARVQDPALREQALRLLHQGLGQLWGQLNGGEREAVRPLLPECNAVVGWPPEPNKEPPPYDGPEESGATPGWRVVDIEGGYATRPPNFFEEKARAFTKAFPPWRGLSQVDGVNGQGGMSTAEMQVRRYLDHCPSVGIEEVVKATGFSKHKIRRIKAWKAHVEKGLDQFLRKNPTAGTKDVKGAFGIARSTTVETKAWKDHQERRLAAQPDPQVRQRPLTDKMLQSCPDRGSVDPRAVVENRDHLFRTIIEDAESKTKGALNHLTEAEKEKLLDDIISAIDVDESKGLDQAKVRGIIKEFTKSWLEEREDDRRRESRQERRC